jgi:hypothetical protein
MLTMKMLREAKEILEKNQSFESELRFINYKYYNRAMYLLGEIQKVEPNYRPSIFEEIFIKAHELNIEYKE